MPFDFDRVNVAVNAAMGEPVVYEAVSGGVLEVNGMFTDAYREPALRDDGTTGWTTTAPTLGVRVGDFSFPHVKNDLVTVVRTGKRYIVVDKHADSVGWVVLILMSAP